MRRQHGQQHHEAEIQRGGAGGNAGDVGVERAHQDDDDENINHRPAADFFRNPVQQGNFADVERHAVAAAQQQKGHGENLQDRNHDARAENNRRNRTVAAVPHKDNAAHDGADFGNRRVGGNHNRQHVGGEVEHRRRQQEGPRQFLAVRPAGEKMGAAHLAEDFFRRPEVAAAAATDFACVVGINRGVAAQAVDLVIHPVFGDGQRGPQQQQHHREHQPE